MRSSRSCAAPEPAMMSRSRRNRRRIALTLPPVSIILAYPDPATSQPPEETCSVILVPQSSHHIDQSRLHRASFRTVGRARSRAPRARQSPAPRLSVVSADASRRRRSRLLGRKLPLALATSRKHGKRLVDQLAEDFGGALLAGYEADALTRHQRASLDIPIDHRAPQRTGPEMLDLQLSFPRRQFAPRATVDDPPLQRDKPLGCRIGKRAYRNHWKPRIELNRCDRIARCGTDEGPLEAWMRD